jgi:PAS domain S-box-containing protein
MPRRETAPALPPAAPPELPLALGPAGTHHAHREERFRQLADAMPQLVWTATADGVVDYYNARAAEYAGLRQRGDGAWTWELVLHEDDIVPTLVAWQHAVATGEPYEIEHRVRMADGMHRWHISRGVRMEGADGSLRWYGTATDIQATRAAQEEARASEERVRLAAEIVGFGNYDADVASQERYWSLPMRTIVGLLPDAPLPPWRALVHPDDLPDVAAAAEARLDPAGDGTYRIEHRIVRPDGQVRWIVDQSRTFFDGEGKDRRATRVIGAVLDITERRHAEELRDAFIGMLSHELRTPVTSIYGGALVLRRPGLDPHVRDDILNGVVEESARLVRLVENLLVIVKVERNAELGEQEPILLRPIVERVAETARGEHPDTVLEVATPRGLPAVRGDEGAVELVLRNLVSNAIKYGAGRPVMVRTDLDQDAGTVCVRVLDSGPGLRVPEPARLFELFYRVELAKRTAAGAGIGLYVVHALVRAMGGTVWARDRTEGGSEFGFALPSFSGPDGEDDEVIPSEADVARR